MVNLDLEVQFVAHMPMDKQKQFFPGETNHVKCDL